MHAVSLKAPPGCFRRKIILVASGEVVHGALEDDQHHFVITVEHDGVQVTALTSLSHRTPWSTCASAAGQLQTLVGRPLAIAAASSADRPDPHLQCTHHFDLALLAMAQAGRGGRRQYELEVGDPVDGIHRALAVLDRHLVLDWQLRGSTVIQPPAWAGTDLRSRGLRAPDGEPAESVAVLRRAVMVAQGRSIDLDQYHDLLPLAQRMTGACHAFQPERHSLGLRNKGSTLEFSAHPERLLKNFPN